MSFFTKLRDATETAGALLGSYYVPGSSLLTQNLTSQGSQKQLKSPLGQVAQLGTGLVGAGVGSGITGIDQSPIFGSSAAAAPQVAPTGGVSSAIPGAAPVSGAPASFMTPSAAGTMPTAGGIGSGVTPGYQTMGQGLANAGSWMADHPVASAMGVAGLGSIYSSMHQPAPPSHNVHMIGTATPNSQALTSDQQAYNAAHSAPGQAQYYLNPNAGYTVSSGYDVSMPGYAAGGIASMDPHYIQGQGDGMSDSIPAHIQPTQTKHGEPIKVANNEFIVPADVVSHLGNGSSDAGAKQLHSMMDRVRKARTGKTKQAPQINAKKFMPL